MQEINTSDKRFTDGNGRDRMGTVVTAAWLNGVQDELVGLVRGLGGTPNPQTPNQIWQLLQTALDGKAPNQTATTARAGIVRLSSAVNSNDETVAATAKAVKAAFDKAASVEAVARAAAGIDLSWDAVSGKPELAPRSHNHNIADITGLQTALNGKLNSSGGDLSGRLRLRYSSSSHWVGMVIDNTARGKNIYWDAESAGTPVGGFQIVSDGAAAGEYRAVINITPPGNNTQNRRRSGMVVAHDHIDTAAYGRLDRHFASKTELNGKANSSHTHQIGDTAGLQTALDGKVGKSGTDNIGGQKIFTGSIRVPTAAAASNDTTAASTAFVKTAVSQAVPSGTVAWFAGSTAPAGWLKANGASVSRSTYAALFAAIGTTYGGSGNHFNLPDLRGEFIRGWDDGRNTDRNRALGSAQAHNMAEHHHGIGIMNQTDDMLLIERKWTGGGKTYPNTPLAGEWNRYLPGSMTHERAVSWERQGGEILHGFVEGGRVNSNRNWRTGDTDHSDHDRRAVHHISTADQDTTGGETRPRNIALLACIKI